MTEEHPQGFHECKDELTIRNTEEYFLTAVFGKDKCSLMAAEGMHSRAGSGTTDQAGVKIKPLAGKRPKMPAVRIAAAVTG